jgi:hypothetical protein
MKFWCVLQSAEPNMLSLFDENQQAVSKKKSEKRKTGAANIRKDFERGHS